MASEELTEQSDEPNFDLKAPIDIGALKARIGKSGPLYISDTAKSFLTTIDVINLEEKTIDGDEHIITVVLASGFTSLSTIVSPARLAEFSSIGDFAATYFRELYLIFDPSGELRYIEDQIQDHLGIDVLEVYASGVPEGGIETTLSKECEADLWRANNLEVILNTLSIHRGMRESVGGLDGDQTIREAFPSPNDLVLLMEQHYNLGFLTARLISEHFVRYELSLWRSKGSLKRMHSSDATKRAVKAPRRNDTNGSSRCWPRWRSCAMKTQSSADWVSKLLPI